MRHPKIKIKCLYCHKEKEVYFSDIQRGKGKFCNPQCWNKYKRKLPEFITCKWCKKEFKNIQSQRTKVFCSKQCQTEWQKGKPIPPNIQNKRGIKPRTYHLKKRPKHEGAEYNDWRLAVWKRDNFTCQNCGKTANELKKEGIKICADHIKPYCNYPKLRYKISNGRTLCIPCHKLTETYGYRARYF